MSDEEMVEYVPKAKMMRGGRGAPLRGRGERSRPGRGSMNRRQEEFRKRDNLVFEKERKERAKRLSFANLEEQPEISQAISIGETVQPLLQQVQVSTRGLFFNTLVCYQQLRLLLGQQVENMCTPIVACRAALLQGSLKAFNANECRELETLAPQVDVRPVLPLGVRDVIKGYTRGFALTNITISGIGRAHLNQVDLWPVVVPFPTDDIGNVQPSPFQITAGNLRDCVVAMSIAGAAEDEVREFFHLWNVFPNAQYDAFHHILNPDAVCPPDWPTEAQADDDLRHYQALISLAKRKSPGIVSEIDYGPGGSGACIVSCNLPDDDAWAVIPALIGPPPVAYVIPGSGRRIFSVNHRIEQQLFERGAISLLGECPDDYIWSSRYADQSLAMLEYNWSFAASRVVQTTIK